MAGMDVQVGSGVAETPSVALSDYGPAKTWQKDDETLEVPALFAVESYQGKEEGWVLECRIDESGWGSPLVWFSKQKALEYVVEAAEQGGWDSARVVVFQASGRIAAIAPCAACGEQGHTELTCPTYPPKAAAVPGLTPPEGLPVEQI